MSWQDRLKPAAYTSPSGKRMEFAYENVSERFDKKTSAFDFSDTDGTFVQDLGRTGFRYPLKMIFTGENYDVHANAFTDMLSEKGIGVLEHPMYGRKNVIPFGTIERRDDLKTASNQAIFTVTFFETHELAFPKETSDPADEVIKSLRVLDTQSAEEFSEELAFNDTIEVVATREQLLVSVASAEANLGTEVDQSGGVLAEFETVAAAVVNDIKRLRTVASAATGEMKTLGRQINRLILIPANAASPIASRLATYRNVINVVLSTVHEQTIDAQGANRYRADNLFATQALAAAIASTLDADFSVRSDVLLAAEILMEMQADVTTWQDANLASLGIIDSGEAYQTLHDATVSAAGFLVEISFTLKQERSLILTEPRSIIDLCAELYGVVDAQLDFFITSNALAGEEIIEIPVGRRVVYYT